VPEDPVVRPVVWGTVAFALVSAAAVSAEADAVRASSVVFDLILFALGTLAFVRTLFVAAERSRREELSVAGIWFLAGSAPPDVRRWLLGCLGAQTVIAIVAASIRPYSAVAFGVLVPMFGLGLTGLWAVRSGTFPPRRAGRTD
jgi:hypothetical protein